MCEEISIDGMFDPTDTEQILDEIREVKNTVDCIEETLLEIRKQLTDG